MTPFSSRRRVGRLLAPLGALAVFAALRAVTGDFPATWFLVAAALLAAVQAGAWLSSRLELQPTGLLVVTGPVPGRQRVLDLTALREVTARQRVTRPNSGGLRVHDVLDLADASGDRLSLLPREWARGDLLVAAVEQAAPLREVPVTGGELFGLTAPADPLPPPPPPAPAGPQPALDLRLRLRGLWLLFGIVFAFVGGVVGLMFAGAAMLLGVVRAPEPNFQLVVLVPVLVGAAFLLGGLYACGAAIAARLRVGADGLLSVRSVPPWRTRTVALRELAAVEARHAGYLSVNRAQPRPRVALRLRERTGRAVTLDAGSWTRPDLVAAAVARGATASGLDLDPATSRYLATGAPPAQVSSRP